MTPQEETFVTYKFLLKEIQNLSKEMKQDRHEFANNMQKFMVSIDDKIASVDSNIKELEKQVRYTNGKVIRLREDVDAIKHQKPPKKEQGKLLSFSSDNWNRIIFILSMLAVFVGYVIEYLTN